MKPFFLLCLTLLPLGILRAQNSASPPANSADSFAPLDYFDANCARCHGPNGSFYGANFGKNLKDDAALRQIVKEMCDGPGGAPLDGADLETLTDFHRALREGKPYLVVSSVTERKWNGEALPGTQITLQNGEKTAPVTLDGHKWSIEIPAEFDISKTQLRALKDGQETVLYLVTKN